MTLSSLLPPDRIQRRSFKWRGYPVTVWKGHRITENTFQEFHERELYLLNGTHGDMLRDHDTPRMLCAIRHPETKQIVSYTLLIDGGDCMETVGTETNGVLGMVGTYTDHNHLNKGWATLALRLMAQQIQKLGGGDDEGISHVFVQYHVIRSFRKILTSENDQLMVHSFNYLNDLDDTIRKCRTHGAPNRWNDELMAA